MKLLSLLFVSVGLLAQSQTKLAPDCSASFQITGLGHAAQIDNRTVSSATGVPCRYWTLSYYVDGFSGISIQVESAEDSNGTPGSFSLFGGTVVNGSNPSTVATSSTVDLNGYFPWMRINVTSLTGSGAIRGTLNGYRTTGTTIASTAAGAAAYNLIENSGSPLPQHTTLNFTGAITCADDTGRTTCTGSSSSGSLFAQTTNSLGSLTSNQENDLVNSAGATGSATLPANFFQVGTTLRFYAEGFYTTTGSPGSWVLRLYIGGSPLVTSLSFAPTASVTNGVWNFEGIITCRSTGAPGTVIMNTLAKFQNNSLGNLVVPMPMTAAGSVTTTGTLLFDLTIQPNASGQSMTTTNLILRSY